VTQQLIFYLLKIFNINFGKTVFITWIIRGGIVIIDMDEARWTYCIISHRVPKYLKPILHDAIAVMVNRRAYYYISVIYCVFIAGACSHVRSYHYFAHSIWSRDDYIAYRCSSYADFQADQCVNASKNLMGEYSDRNKFVVYFYTLSSPLFKYYLLKI